MSYQNNNDYNRFLGLLYNILYRNEVIKKVPGTYKINGESVKLSKGKIVNNYLEKLDRVQTKAYQNDKLDLLKELYYEKYLIKMENIDDNYWHKLEERYLEEGHGHLNLVSPKDIRDESFRNNHFQTIYQAQKSSLDAWLNYLFSPDANYLPM